MNRWKWIILGVLILLLVPVAAVFIKETLGPQTRGINLQYLSGVEAASVLRSKLSKKDREIVEGWSSDAVFVKGSKSDYQNALDIVEKEDKPAPEVSLKFQIIEADGFTQSDSAIAPIESVLRGLFRFKGYRLSAEAFLRTRENSEAQQSVSGPDEMYYSIQVGVGDVARREGKASVTLRTTLSILSNQVLSTTVNVPEGQTVVLGTARPWPRRAALILVVTPELK